MPLRSAPALDSDALPCAQCGHTTGWITLHGGPDPDPPVTVRLCANCALAYTPGLLPMIPTLPGQCVACAAPHPETLLVGDADYVGRFCRAHAQAFLRYGLDPEAFRAVLHDAGGDPERVFALHGDFYDARTGVARQPVPPTLPAPQ